MSPVHFFFNGCLIKAIKGLQGHKIRLLVLLSWPDNLTRTRRMTVTRTQGQGWDEDKSNKRRNDNYEKDTRDGKTIMTRTQERDDEDKDTS